MVDILRSLVGSFRPPRTRSAVHMPAVQPGPFTLALASGSTPVEAVGRLTELAVLPVHGSVLVIPSVANRPGRGAHPHAVAAILRYLGSRATLGIPFDTPGSVRRRWEQLAKQCSVSSVRLGSSGWDEVELRGEEFLLDRAIVPAEMHQFDHRLAIPALADESLGLGFMRTVVHSHTRLRARGNQSRARLDAEIARAVEAHFLLDASRLPGLIATNLMASASDALTIELAGLAIHRFIDQVKGFETVGAWEHERVQAAAELGLGPASGGDILLRVHHDDSKLAALSAFFAAELGCAVESVESGLRNA